MDKYVYNALCRYFNALTIRGYVGKDVVIKLILLIFYYHLTGDDYRGYVNKEDYLTIERALNCLFGTNCLMPYPDYLKMGKLKLGEMTEMAQRIKSLESEPVLKLVHDLDSVVNPDEHSDIVVVADN